jgi:glyoxylase-like metal-dependent hydrolase (beta-lactamase superfamily II)
VIADAIRGLGHHPADVRRLVLTHFHRDHTGSAAEVASWGDIVVLAHQAEAAFIRGEAAGPEAVLLDWERDLMARSSSRLPPDEPPPVRIDRAVSDGEQLWDGAEAVWVPGHTPGSLAVYLPGPKVLFTGDTIASGPDGRPVLGVFNVDRARAIESLRRQAALDVDIACFGHGEPLTTDTTTQLRALADHLTR